MRRRAAIAAIALVVGAFESSTLLSAQELPPRERERVLARVLERLRSGVLDRPVLRRQQALSLQRVLARGLEPAPMPDDTELARYREVRKRYDSEALTYLDDFYGRQDTLKAIAVRDSDGDSVPDLRVSDYYGKFMEGDVDVDGDGIRNLYDSHPYDRASGGNDDDGDGIPDAGFVDDNGNGLPDHIDWAAHKDDVELSQIQLGLFQDHQILLVDRDSSFDLALARAVDDSVRRVFRAYFDEREVLPTLRTVATERTALLNAVAAYFVGDDTSAQVFSQTQSLIVYDSGRAVDNLIGLLGLVVHEMGHSYHMSLDFDAGDIVAENGRIDFPATNFAALVRPFGWTTNEMFDGRFEADAPLMPRYVYAGVLEPIFLFREESPQRWQAWVEELFVQLDDSSTYLHTEAFATRGIVSDYSLSTPYEWYGDNLIAYVLTAIETHALEALAGDEAATEAAKDRVDEALRRIWPGFYHRNLAPNVRDYFERTFPITAADRGFLAERYVDPILSATR